MPGRNPGPFATMLLPLYAAAVFVSAFLLFWVQPLFAKMVLPLLGGAPAVWNTAMVFFQLVLLAGYGYAHLLARGLRPRAQVLAHGVVLGLGLIALPIAVPHGAEPPADGSPVIWLLGLLALGVGLPFWALSATAPLLQAWFARTGNTRGGDPYFLYAASNLGSLLSLLAFPFALEPGFSLGSQARVWMGGYIALIILAMLCGGSMRSGEITDRVALPRASWRQRGTWIILAALPSSLLLGVTTHISTDVAAAPLLWVVPLALYLLSFVIAFAGGGLRVGAGLLKLQAGLLVGVGILMLAAVALRVGSLATQLLVHLGSFFVTALVCHAELARRRPPVGNLTEFYLYMSIGGAAGGMFNALAAPSLFDGTYEYPLALVGACALRALCPGAPRGWRVLDLAAPLLLGLFVAGFALAWPDTAGGGIGARALLLMPAALALYGFSPRPARFALGLAAMLVATPIVRDATDLLHQERSFFGVHRVVLTESGQRTALFHGQTLHGAQLRDPAARHRPLGYYSSLGPAGQVFAALPQARRIGVVGLGTGALACLARPGQSLTFFEIDPTVARIARDRRWFTFLEDCAPEATIEIADGRLALARRSTDRFDILVVDAFSSDSIPMHLLTREAMALYLDRLTPGGVLLLHISNLYLDLPPVVAAAIADLGASARVQLYGPDAGAHAQGAGASHWAVVAPDGRALAMLDGDARWEPLRAAQGARPWTDDFSDLLGALAR